jgi:hypothetical protein
MGGEREESISEPGGLPGPDGAAMVRARRNPDSGGRIGWDDVADIFDEVNEDLRAERAQALLKRYGVLLLAAMLLVVAGAAAWQGWRWWRGKQDMAVATEYMAAMTRADAPGPGQGAARPEALAGFEQVAAKAPDGYATLARLRAAALKASAGDLAGATALWDQVAGDASADRLLRDLASLTSVQHQIETGDPGALESRLGPLASPDNPWHALAMEQQALLSMRTAHTAEATDTLRRIAADTTAPEGVRARANGLLERLGGSTS